MAANPSKIVVSTSSKADNANNESKALAELEPVKRAHEQYKKELIDSRPQLSTYKHNEDIYPLSNYFPTVIAKLTIGYLRETEILQLSAIEPPILNIYRSEVYEIMTLRKIVSEKLLPNVTGANPKGIDEFFKNPTVLPKILLRQSESGAVYVHPKILLTKTSYTVGYYSEKLKDFVCLAHLKNISSWQAAFLCGDGPFLGLRLLSYLIENNSLSYQEKDKLLWEARQQLNELINNIAEFLAPLKALIRAYNNYIAQYDALSKQEKWDELDKLWGQVGECHKRLPHYILQEFFSPTPFDPIPDFNTEPSRDECHYWNNDLLNLDELGCVSRFGLYKGGRHGRASRGVSVRFAGATTRWTVALLDLAAMNRLCKLREEGLKHTFNCLQTLKSALTLISNNKNPWIAL